MTQVEEPTQERIKEFWERYEYTGKVESIQPVPGQKEGRLVYVSPPIDLNSLFRLAVPKAISRICWLLHISEEEAYKDLFDRWYTELVATMEHPNSLMTVTYPALALFRILWRVKE